MRVTIVLLMIISRVGLYHAICIDAGTNMRMRSLTTGQRKERKGKNNGKGNHSTSA